MTCVKTSVSSDMLFLLVWFFVTIHLQRDMCASGYKHDLNLNDEIVEDVDTTLKSETRNLKSEEVKTKIGTSSSSLAVAMTTASTWTTIVANNTHVTKRNTKTMADLARENVLGMKSNTVRCSQPRPKVIRVQDYHPHAYKRYVPSCVVLHRCARDTGCCDEQGATCTVRRRRKVSLYFYIVSLANKNGTIASESAGQIEALRFFNHTECFCKRRKKPTPKTEKPRDLERTSAAMTLRVVTYIQWFTFCVFWIGRTSLST